MNSQTHQSHLAQASVPRQKLPISAGRTPSVIPQMPSSSFGGKRKKNNGIRCVSNTTKAIEITEEQSLSVKAVISVKLTAGGFLSSLGLSHGVDDIIDLVGKSIHLELVSAELDPKTGKEKETIKGYAHRSSQEKDEVKYECDFEIPKGFGGIGGVLVENEHHNEMYLKNIVFDGLAHGVLMVTCNSWVAPKSDNSEKRIFFTNKSYLPCQTPGGLTGLRKKELENLRGNGQGERKTNDRIYDYDVYNDLGNPDSKPELKRPVLGGKQHPYPRRCRTGRPHCKTDPLSESRSAIVYVPRDEAFSEVKLLTFTATTADQVAHALFQSLDTIFVDPDLGFATFTDIESLFNEGIHVPPLSKNGFLKDLFPRILKSIADTQEEVIRFETPKMFERDRFSWFRDEEFARQTLAGVNPYSIQLVKEWPLMSKLNPEIYGAPESAITTEVVEQQIKGFMTLEEALQKKKLFMLDYHDLLLPYVKRVRDIKGTTLYGSRTLFFLTPDGTLMPLAIELTRPPLDGKPLWRQVFTPSSCDATACWLWRLAKTHVLAHDSGHHELISHWLRTHCATEPYIIATNRQLSAMHPVYRLLHPHFRYTMEINALAREALINADGIIESSFSPAKYSMELSSVAYEQQWQFDLQALPADLISRGMAVEDSTAPHGLKLTIEDYPFANDGLLVWDAIWQWVTEYVKHYYPDEGLVKSDEELQAWWTEIRTVGHADKKDAPWWPVLNTSDDLIGILTTIIWVASCHHAAVNFGQYAFGGYFPNRPTIARRKIPTEDQTDEEWNHFLNKPEEEVLLCFPSQIQATKVMAILYLLSNHSIDEEYLGQEMESSWAENPKIRECFELFNGKLREIVGIIDTRNKNKNLKNRSGAGVVPYELLKPFSQPGVTAKGVPNSISI
ncbi:Linoleate 13S-lipoxygenase [Bertholletia excelsa]